MVFAVIGRDMHTNDHPDESTVSFDIARLCNVMLIGWLSSSRDTGTSDSSDGVIGLALGRTTNVNIHSSIHLVGGNSHPDVVGGHGYC